jgi:hypothetical protein
MMGIKRLKTLDDSRPLNQWPLHAVDSRLEAYKRQMLDELKAYGLRIDFHLWISDEWFCPDGVPGFALLFTSLTLNSERSINSKQGTLMVVLKKRSSSSCAMSWVTPSIMLLL